MGELLMNILNATLEWMIPQFIDLDCLIQKANVINTLVSIEQLGALAL